MRVVAGQFRGRRLQAPPGETTRPILDRAKVALFDWLGAQLLQPGALPPIHVLDLFSGAGSLGIEALSRGVASCTFVEKDPAALKSLRTNLEELAISHECEVIAGSVDTVRFPKPPGGYGLIFLDPPYPLTVEPSPNSVMNKLLARLERDVPLATDALLVWRYERGWVTPEILPGRWSPPQRRSWGTTEIAIYRHAEGAGTVTTPHHHSSPPRPPMSMRAAALFVLRRLRDKGHNALFAGGCVRDMLLGKRPADYDIATDARPQTIVDLFRRTRKVGMKFGVVLVGMQRYWIEVATFRADVNYVDGRRPERIEFTDAREDALRRDFTINGMFYDPLKREVIDYVGGRDDLTAKVLRAIGTPNTRFAEDHLRMLRAIRFAARFGFEIEPATWSAIQAHAAAIARISPERIHDEIEAILIHPNRGWAFGELHATGLLPHLWPGSAVLTDHATDTRRLLAALPAKAGFDLALSAMLHRLPLEQVQAACESLRTSNRVLKYVTWLTAKQDAFLHPADVTLADLKLLMAHRAFDDLMAMFAAKLKASDQPPSAYRRVAARVRAIQPEDVTPPPLITGDHLQQLGLAAGPRYKAILDKVYYAQLNGDLTDRPAAKAFAKRLIDETS